MSTQTPVEVSPEVPSVQTCRHHWIIQSATGPVSEGVCQVCGEVREFSNHVGASSRADERPKLHSQAASSAEMTSTIADYLDSADGKEE